jgi:hypothetical protein
MFLAVFGQHQVYFTVTYMEKNYQGGDFDIVGSIVQNNLQFSPVEMFCNCSLKIIFSVQFARHNLDLSRAKFRIPGCNQ